MSAVQQVLFCVDTADGGGGEPIYEVTWNSADKDSDITLSGSDLIATRGADDNGSVRATHSRSSGTTKWQVEYVSVAPTDTTFGQDFVGFATAGMSLSAGPGSQANGWGWKATGGVSSNGNSVQGGTPSASFTSSDEVQMVWDSSAGTITCYKNGTISGDVVTGVTGPLFPCVGGSGAGTCPYTANFGASAFANAISGTTSWDGNIVTPP